MHARAGRERAPSGAAALPPRPSPRSAAVPQPPALRCQDGAAGGLLSAPAAPRHRSAAASGGRRLRARLVRGERAAAGPGQRHDSTNPQTKIMAESDGRSFKAVIGDISYFPKLATDRKENVLAWTCRWRASHRSKGRAERDRCQKDCQSDAVLRVAQRQTRPASQSSHISGLFSKC